MMEYPSTDVYSSVLLSCIDLSLGVHHDIFDPEAIELLESLGRLDNGSFALLSRLQGRKPTWLRVDNLAEYFAQLPTLVEAMRNLREHMVLDTLEVWSDLDFDLVWSAVQGLRHQELKSLANKISSTSHTSGSKSGLLLKLKKIVQSQQTLFGSKSLVEKLPGFVNAVLRPILRDRMDAAYGGQLTRQDGLEREALLTKALAMSSTYGGVKTLATAATVIGSIHAHASRDITCSDETGILSTIAERSVSVLGKEEFEEILRDLPCLVRFKPEVLLAIRRAQRLEQITATISSSLSSSSVSCPIYYNAPLLVAFKKVKYPTYKMIKTVPLFHPRIRFEQWESGCELSYAFELAAAIDSLEASSSDQPSSTSAYSSSKTGKTDAYSAAKSRANELRRKAAEIILKAARAFDCASMRPSTTTAGASAVGETHGQRGKKQREEMDYNSRKTNTDVVLSWGCRPISVDDIIQCPSNFSSSLMSLPPEFPATLSVCLCAVVCMIAYRSYHCGDNSAVTAGTTAEARDEEQGDSETMMTTTAAAAAAEEVERPDFFIQFDPGAALASLCNEAAEFIEKNGLGDGIKDYATANMIYELLLSCPFLPHRRSRWYTRLCINITHMHTSTRYQGQMTDNTPEDIDGDAVDGDGDENGDDDYLDGILVDDVGIGDDDEVSRLNMYSQVLQTAERALNDSTVTMGGRVALQRRANTLRTKLQQTGTMENIGAAVSNSISSKGESTTKSVGATIIGEETKKNIDIGTNSQASGSGLLDGAKSELVSELLSKLLSILPLPVTDPPSRAYDMINCGGGCSDTGDNTTSGGPSAGSVLLSQWTCNVCTFINESKRTTITASSSSSSSFFSSSSSSSSSSKKKSKETCAMCFQPRGSGDEAVAVAPIVLPSSFPSSSSSSFSSSFKGATTASVSVAGTQKSSGGGGRWQFLSSKPDSSIKCEKGSTSDETTIQAPSRAGKGGAGDVQQQDKRRKVSILTNSSSNSSSSLAVYRDDEEGRNSSSAIEVYDSDDDDFENIPQNFRKAGAQSSSTATGTSSRLSSSRSGADDREKSSYDSSTALMISATSIGVSDAAADVAAVEVKASKPIVIVLDEDESDDHAGNNNARDGGDCGDITTGFSSGSSSGSMHAVEETILHTHAPENTGKPTKTVNKRKLPMNRHQYHPDLPAPLLPPGREEQVDKHSAAVLPSRLSTTPRKFHASTSSVLAPECSSVPTAMGVCGLDLSEFSFLGLFSLPLPTSGRSNSGGGGSLGNSFASDVVTASEKNRRRSPDPASDVCVDGVSSSSVGPTSLTVLIDDLCQQCAAAASSPACSSRPDPDPDPRDPITTLSDLSPAAAAAAVGHRPQSELMKMNPETRMREISEWEPLSFDVRGRRYGDPSKKGKSRFIGQNEEVVTVERFILQKCFHVEDDDPEYFREVIDGGGWQGWHCETTIFRSLFGLLMWGELFSDHPNVFQTPFQDAPLDLCFPSFIRTRRETIFTRLCGIASASPSQLLSMVGESYRAHYRQRCRGVSWDVPLRTYQLVGICLGGRGVAAVCRALSTSYKHFSGGAPDLFLVRVCVLSPEPEKGLLPKKALTGLTQQGQSVGTGTTGGRTGGASSRPTTATTTTAAATADDEDTAKVTTTAVTVTVTVDDNDHDHCNPMVYHDIIDAAGLARTCLDLSSLLGDQWESLCTVNNNNNNNSSSSSPSNTKQAIPAAAGDDDDDRRAAPSDDVSDKKINIDAEKVLPISSEKNISGSGSSSKREYQRRKSGRRFRYGRKLNKNNRDDDLFNLSREEEEEEEEEEADYNDDGNDDKAVNKGNVSSGSTDVRKRSRARISDAFLQNKDALKRPSSSVSDNGIITSSSTSNVTAGTSSSTSSGTDTAAGTTMVAGEVRRKKSTATTAVGDVNTLDSSDSGSDVEYIDDHVRARNNCDVGEINHHNSMTTTPYAANETFTAATTAGQKEDPFVCTQQDLKLPVGWEQSLHFECMAVEVKGPTDSLADNQLMWQLVLSAHGVPCYVGHVREKERKERREKRKQQKI